MWMTGGMCSRKKRAREREVEVEVEKGEGYHTYVLPTYEDVDTVWV